MKLKDTVVFKVYYPTIYISVPKIHYMQGHGVIAVLPLHGCQNKVCGNGCTAEGERQQFILRDSVTLLHQMSFFYCSGSQSFLTNGLVKQ
jgi:hypothetical protein